jgi:DNA-directed RNA polymerase specialized sigma24 family protein
VSTRRDGDGSAFEGIAPHGGARSRPPSRLGPLDQAQAVALVARSRRELLLRAHRHRLAHEDLEDCYSQATLELLTRARRGDAPFASDAHVANALEQRLLSRIQDRQRAISGRSPIETALFRALPLGDPERGDVEAIDVRVDVERLIMMRHDLRRISEVAPRLTPDQRLVLASQLARDMRPAEFCQRHGWSVEKYRKVAQRARARLRKLLDEAPDHEAPEQGTKKGAAATGTPSSGARRGLPADLLESPSRWGVPPAGVGRIREQGPTYEHISPPA